MTKNLGLDPAIHEIGRACQARGRFGICISELYKNNCMTNFTKKCWTNVEDFGPTLYKWYANVLCLLGFVFNKFTLFRGHNYGDPLMQKLKRHNQAKIIRKICIFNMSMWCEHDNSLELRKSFKFSVAVATQQLCRKPPLSAIPVFLILDMACPKLNFVFISGKCTTNNFKNLRNSSMNACVMNSKLIPGYCTDHSAITLEVCFRRAEIGERGRPSGNLTHYYCDVIYVNIAN